MAQGFVVPCVLAILFAVAVPGGGSMCGAMPPPDLTKMFSYENVFGGFRGSQINFIELPGFTRSVYKRNYALVTPESRVWAGNPKWPSSLTSHVISPATSPATHFSMFLVDMGPASAGLPAATGVERFVFVLNGELTADLTESLTLSPGDYIYLPPNSTVRLSSDGAGLLVFERAYASQGSPKVQHGSVEDSPTLDTPGEVFVLRKLLPATADYDFNVHVMDFQPGQSLNVKEIHYNQHGLLLAQGEGIYRLGEDWYPVQAGDMIWMGPYVTQWYAALGQKPTRYILYKDTTIDPLFS